MKADSTLRSVRSIAYICTNRAIGANHHFAIGSNAPPSNSPERAAKRRFTKADLPT